MQTDLPFSEETPPPKKERDAGRRPPARAFRRRDASDSTGWVLRDPAAILTVSQVGAALRTAIDRSFPRRITVRGELSNVVRHASGHLYFSLRDDRSALRCAMFRSAARSLRFEPENGIEVDVRGELDVYQARGELQLVVDGMRPAGVGAQLVALEALKRRLGEEGLLDAGRKRALPRIPRVVGVVTSASGAALRDVLEVARRRFPSLPIWLAAAAVQGDGAEASICAALRRLSACEAVDVVLLVRGGGAFEDLHAFNAESVARAVAASPKVVVAGVGHETDVTLVDLVADVRAATPSHAAELVVPRATGLSAELRRACDRMTAAVERRLGAGLLQLDRARRTRALADPARHLHERRRRLDDAVAALPRELEHRLAGGRLQAAALGPRLARALEHRAGAAGGRVADGSAALRRAATLRFERPAARLAALEGALRALGPRQVLARGYVVARAPESGRAVTAAEQVAPGRGLRLDWHDGHAVVRVDTVRRTGTRDAESEERGV